MNHSPTPRSLTQRLVVKVLLAEFLCALVFSTIAIVHERSIRRHAFDMELRGRADSLLGAVQDAEDPADNVMVDKTELYVPQEDRYEVLAPSGRILGHSSTVSYDLLAQGAGHTDGYFNVSSEGVRYRALRTEGVRVIDREENGGIRRPVTLLYAAPTSHLWPEVMEAVRFYVLLSITLLAATGVLLAWLLRRGLFPLRDLAHRAGQVSILNWNFHPPEETLQTAELAPIAHAIRDLLADLRRAFERERQFTGDSAHEFKTSVAVLKSSLQLLAMRRRTVDEYVQGLNGLLFDVERLEELINRMLTLTRIEEAPRSGIERTDIGSVAASLALRFRPLSETREVSIEVRSPQGCEVLMAAEDAEILCSNLLMNAIQHSPPSSAVLIAIEAAAGAIHLLVKDNGRGIPAEALPHVFERFFRADPSRSRHTGGAGLGLATCKAIADRYDASITIESAKDRGTSVQVSIPAARNAMSLVLDTSARAVLL